MKYETYRRIRVTHPFLVLLTYGGIALTLAVVVPILLRSGDSHLDIESPHAVRFLHSVKPGTVAEEMQQEESAHSREVAASRNLLDESVRALQMIECADGYTKTPQSSKKGAAVCSFRDFIEIIESDSEAAFVTTSIKEVIESRSRVTPKKVAVPGLWGQDDELAEPIEVVTVAPQLTRLAIDHKLANEYFTNMSEFIGFLLTREECQAIDTGSSPVSVLDAVRFKNETELLRSGRRVLRGGKDIFKLDELLNAANLTIDQVRFSGVHLDVRVTFSNLVSNFAVAAAAAAASSSDIGLFGWLSDVFTLPAQKVYFYCAEAVADEAKFFYSSRLSSSERSDLKGRADPQKAKRLQKQQRNIFDDDDAAAAAAAASDPSTVVLNKTTATKHKKDYRKISTHFGVRAKVRTLGSFGVASNAAALRFIASLSSLLALPYVVAEFLISYLPQLGMEPRWWGEFIIDR